MPAPPPESEPAMVRAVGTRRFMVTSFARLKPGLQNNGPKPGLLESQAKNAARAAGGVTFVRSLRWHYPDQVWRSPRYWSGPLSRAVLPAPAYSILAVLY